MSISRDLEMSQFWQNLQARLQPAVPNDSTARAGQEVVERLLLHRVDAEPARPAVRREHDLVVHAAADEAQPALALVQPAGARAHVALDPAVVERCQYRVGTVCGSSRVIVSSIADASRIQRYAARWRNMEGCGRSIPRGSWPCRWSWPRRRPSRGAYGRPVGCRLLGLFPARFVRARCPGDPRMGRGGHGPRRPKGRAGFLYPLLEPAGPLPADVAAATVSLVSVGGAHRREVCSQRAI